MMIDFVEATENGLNIEKHKSTALVTETVDLWRQYTNAISPLLISSQKAWSMYLSQQSAGADKKQRVKIGHISRTIEAVHSFQHNTTFPSDERFFKGMAHNDYAREYLDLYETWAATNFAEAGVLEAFFAHRKRAMVDGTACLAVPFTQKRCKKVTYQQPTLTIPSEVDGGSDILLSLKGLPPVRHEDPNGLQWEGTEAISLDFSDWRVDPTASNIDDSTFLRRWYEPL